MNMGYLCRLAFCLWVVIAASSALQFMGKVLYKDWPYSASNLPSVKEPLDLKNVASERVSKRFTFKAYQKSWTVDVVLNNLLSTSRTKVTQRSRTGTILKTFSVPKDCFYIGTVRADNSEYGMASITTCDGEVRGYLATNTNDYLIYDRNWRLTGKRSYGDEWDLGLEVANLTEYHKYMGSFINSSTTARLRRDFPPIVPDIGKPQQMPNGRAIYLETGVIVDKYYIADFNSKMSPSMDALVLHIMETMNNAQIWFVHPTFGFQIWLLLSDLIIVNDQLLTEKANAQMQKISAWAKQSFPENAQWDTIFTFSSEPNIWNGREGAGGIGGVCTDSGQLCGVSPTNFQLASLARLLVHEGAHSLSLRDDYMGPTAEVCYSGMMRDGVWQDHDWSVCSMFDLSRWLEMKASDCVTRPKTPSLAATAQPPPIPVNVAWRSNVVQSSTLSSEAEWGAFKAVDGPLLGLRSAKGAAFGSCTQTKREDFPWIRIELPLQYQTQPTETVIIYNREDCCSNILKNFEVRIGDSSNIKENALCLTFTGTVPGGVHGAAVIQCTTALSGRYVSIQLLTRTAILTVCEVQVMKRVRLDDFRMGAESCVDTDYNCRYWQSIGQCTDNPGYMNKVCPFMCGVCTRSGANLPATSATATSSVLPVICKDDNQFCPSWQSSGECTRNPNYMNAYCRLSCGVCSRTESLTTRSPPSLCADNSIHCAYWKNTGECAKNPAYMLDNCKLSCGICL